ncbi:glycosyltransferase [Leptolyngbya sp. FACHB-17]|uniref:glycosyltransferase n=1 Tax=unclassified Leptolyngbya TaxID=2650499 RepID=UPI0016806946|nr:glycosyltransferase [Leptolyngbya sp. FACHB-17]MBD2083201.1 tetratricopeptide repeat protein [Leptolyngbya sp. FACHB-17]
MQLSFCIIVKNEEQNLPQCLRSVQDWVDEMIVLDTGSSDRTVEIARSFGAQVHSFDWCNDFSAARNACLKYAQGDWVLVLDADETLVAEVAPILRSAIEQEEYLVFNLVRREVGAAQSPYSLVSRLFRRHPELWFSRPYHEMIDDQVLLLLQHEPHWKIGAVSEVAILHEGYQADVIAGRDKVNRARSTMEAFLAAHPNDPYVCSKLGALYVGVGETAKGIELLERGLSAVEDASTKYELHYHLGVVYSELNEIEKAAQQYQEAIRQAVLPKLKLGAINNFASLLKDCGDLQNAALLYQQALDIDPTFAIAYCNLGATLKAMGQLTTAIDHYHQAIALNPNYAEAYQNLGVVLLNLGRVPQSLEAFRTAIALHQQQNPSEAERLKLGLREMGLW